MGELNPAKQINLFTGRARKVLPASPKESEIQAAFFGWLKMHETRFPELRFCFAVPNGGFCHKATAAMMKRTGTKAGVPDVFLPIARKGFHGLWIEFKAETGKLSEAQKAFADFLTAQGYRVLICRTWEEAANAAIDYLDLRTKHLNVFGTTKRER